MQYLLLIYLEETAIDDSEREQCYVESTALAQDLATKGQFLAAAPLEPVSTAASLRIREGRATITDGPFAETREYLGGFFMVEARDRDEALRIAARIPAARFGTVEVRPVIEIPGLPGAGAPQPAATVSA